MSGLTYIVVGGVLALIGSVLTTVGISKMKRTEEAFSLAVPPSVEIALQPNQDIGIENTGQHDLVDIHLTPVFYVIQKDPFKVLRRTPSFPIDVVPLVPRAKNVIPFSKIGFIDQKDILSDKTIEMIAAVVVYRRKLDNKRYVEIEPFMTTSIDGKQTLFSLYADRGAGFSGPPGLVITAIKEVLETEKLFFRSKWFTTNFFPLFSALIELSQAKPLTNKSRQ